MRCDIAGIHFQVSNVGAEEFGESFLPFLYCQQAAKSDARCLIELAGADAGLLSEKSDRAWSFDSHDGVAVLSAANPEGDVLWRLTGCYPYEKLSFVWHPELFLSVYSNQGFGSYNIALILALVLRLLELKGIVLHCSASIVDGAGIICTGRSGRGKSTISALLRDNGVAVLSDERAVIRVHEHGLQVYGTPWPSSSNCVLNSSAPLKKLYFLQHGAANRLDPLTPSESLKQLLDVVMVPWLNPVFFDPLIEVLESVVNNVPAATLSFVPDSDVVDFIRADLSGLV